MRTKNISMTRGQTKILNLTVKDDRGARVTLTGSRVFMSIRADMKVDPIVKLASEMTTGYRIGVVISPDQDADRGECTITLIPDDTLELVALGADDPYFWDVWVVGPAGNTYPVISTSQLDLYPQVTNVP